MQPLCRLIQIQMANMLQKELFALEASFICNNIDWKESTIYYLLGMLQMGV